MSINILLYLILWRGYNFNKKISFSNENKISSGFHAIVTFIYSILKILNIISLETFTSVFDFSISYCIHDILFLIQNNIPKKNEIIIHHLIVFTANLLGKLFYSNNLFLMTHVAFNYLTEITTPSLNLSLYYYENKLINKNKTLFLLSTKLTFINFFIFRILNNIFLIYRIYFSGYRFIFLMQSIMTSLNFFWFYKLYRKSKKFID